nr:nucleotidyltransferase domain-containing protein [uncultured Methanospirillum sp.]
MFNIMNTLPPQAIPIICYLGRRWREDKYVREISRETGISTGTVSTTLKTLREQELVVRIDRGRLALYHAAIHNPIVREIKILCTLSEIYPVVRKMQGCVSKIILFGSSATGEDTVDSDIDLMIISLERDEIHRILAENTDISDREVSPIILTPGEFARLKTNDPPLYKRINQGKVVYDGEP